jgi:transcriptional regulator with XRE-family HTH domain
MVWWCRKRWLRRRKTLKEVRLYNLLGFVELAVSRYATTTQNLLWRDTKALYSCRGGRAHRQGANRWEEQFYLGLDLKAQTEYGIAPGDHGRILEILLRAGQKFGQRKLARASNTSLSVLSAILIGKLRPTPVTLAKLYRALPLLQREALEEAELAQEVLEAVRQGCDVIGVRRFARRAGVDAANLAKILSSRRRPSRAMLAKLEAALHTRP